MITSTSIHVDCDIIHSVDMKRIYQLIKDERKKEIISFIYIK